MKFKLLVNTKKDTVLNEFINCRDRISIITGPLGSGKTFGACERLVLQMVEQKPNAYGLRKTRWYAIRNTYPDLMSTTIKDFMDLFGELGHFKGGGIAPPTMTMHFRLRDGSVVLSELVFLALDRPQSIKRLRGAQITGAWLNEIKELPKAVIDMTDFRIGRYPSKIDGGPSWYGILGDTNQCDDDHWLYKLAEEVKPEGWHFFTQPGGLMRNKITGEWEDNPLAENVENLPEGYYTRGKEGKDETWIAVNLGNEYGTIIDGRPVYKEQWFDTIHVSKTVVYNPEEPIYVGLDFGLCPSAVFTQQSPNGGLIIIDEILSVGLGINQFVKQRLKPTVNKHYRNSTIIYVGDPAGNHQAETDKQTVFKELEDLGIECIPANTNKIEPRLEAVRYFLHLLVDGGPGFLVSAQKAPMIRRGFNGGYKFRRIQVVGEERYVSIPDKNKFSHIHDALQYVCMYLRGDIEDSGDDFDRSDEENIRWGT